MGPWDAAWAILRVLWLCLCEAGCHLGSTGYDLTGAAMAPFGIGGRGPVVVRCGICRRNVAKFKAREQVVRGVSTWVCAYHPR